MRLPCWLSLLTVLTGCQASSRASTPSARTSTSERTPSRATAVQSSVPASANAEVGCHADFARARLLVENGYAGYADKVERFGQNEIDEATQIAHESTLGLAAADEACESAIQTWLEVFEDGHLSLEKPGQGKSVASARTAQLSFERVSRSAALLRIATFGKSAELLHLIEKHRGELEAAERLLVDLERERKKSKEGVGVRRGKGEREGSEAEGKFLPSLQNCG